MSQLIPRRPFQPVFRPISSGTIPQIPALSKPFQQSSTFSTSAALQARKQKGPKKDARITQIRYFLQHPKTPRPLRFSRLRALRHWTIHRAWMLFKTKQYWAQQAELERQYNSMHDACEALRLVDENGMVGGEGGKNVGRLYRTAMQKNGIWDGVPIEYARLQVDTPSREGWNHGWKR